MNKKQNIDSLINNPDSPSDLVKKLKLIKDVREFAVSQIQLPQVHGYTDYVDLERSYVTKVVTASPPLELKTYRWCYLFLGCLGYRGYFDPQEAENYAEALKKDEGLDVSIGEVSAYSTLKWLNNDFMPDYFKDPVLNTFLQRTETGIIQTLIHEMAHQVVYVDDDTTFNESFAVFVEQEGVKQYLRSREGDAKQRFERYLLKKKDRAQFIEIVRTYYQKFEKLYTSQLKDEEKLTQKQILFEEMRITYKNKEQKFKVMSYQKWFDRPLNNTHLMGVRMYNRLVPSFEKVFQEQQQDWTAFFKKIKEIAEYPKEKRLNYLKTRCTGPLACSSI